MQRNATTDIDLSKQNTNSFLNIYANKKALITLFFFHLFIIAISNYLVQFPFQIFGIHTTWGSISFPFIFLATDLTVRIFNPQAARKIVFYAMLPALVVSYIFSVLFFEGKFQGIANLAHFNTFVARIALASFCAYAFGQLMDIFVFAKLRQNKRWWVAPSASSLFGNALDTFVFFFIAFYQSSDVFMAENWTNIGFVDFLFKVFISLLFFVPLYGVLLNKISSYLAK